MAEVDLVNRLAALPHIGEIPRNELEWLVEHGKLEHLEAGTVLAHKGKRLETLWIILSGRIVVQVDRGTGPRRVTEWHAGDVSGMLPYSRMISPPGNNFLETDSELFAIHESLFPEMIHHCPTFTAQTVHSMLDRARSFSASDLQDEKMMSLGKLAAGLAHELNNPASAAARGAKLLLAELEKDEEASRALGAAHLSDAGMAAIERVRSICIATPGGQVLSAIEQADREDEIADWLERRDLDPAQAQALSATVVTLDELDNLAGAASGDTLEAALRWIAAGCATHSLAADIERAASRISELVAAVKRFTYMDTVAASEPVDVEAGLRDTIKIMASKARSKGAAITIDVDPGLPRVRANGSELNQVWLNLVDNALDAIAEQGRIDISMRMENKRLAVAVVDNGAGIPTDQVSRIFDPFYTTKPPGQGTGLGLDLTRKILQRHHAGIAVNSRPGRTEFRVTLVVEENNEIAELKESNTK